MSLLSRVEFLCRLGSFTTTSEPTLEQVEEQIAIEYTRLEEEIQRKGYLITDYPYEVAEILVYKVAGEILLGNSRGNESISQLGSKYLEEAKELKKEFYKTLCLATNPYIGEDESTYPDWIDEDVEW